MKNLSCLIAFVLTSSLAWAQWPDEVTPRPVTQPQRPAATPTSGPVEDSGVVIVDRPRGFEMVPKEAAPAPTAAARPLAAPVPIAPAKPLPQANSADEISDVVNQVLPGQEAPPAKDKQEKSDAAPILERARQQWAFLGEAKTVYLECEMVLVQPPTAFDASLKSVVRPDRSILRSERFLGWDNRQIASYVMSDQGQVWAQWLGTEGYAEQIPAAGGDKVRQSKRTRDLSQVLSWTLCPFSLDVVLPAWWVPSSRRDVQGWRPAGAYSVIAEQTFVGQPCTVLAYDDGKERGEEWYDQATGRLVRLRTYLNPKPEEAGREAKGTPGAAAAGHIAPSSAVRRDKIFQDYREVASGKFLPMQTVESVRSSTTGELMSVLHVTVRAVKLDEPLPAWLFDPQRDGPTAGRMKADNP